MKTAPLDNSEYPSIIYFLQNRIVQKNALDFFDISTISLVPLLHRKEGFEQKS